MFGKREQFRYDDKEISEMLDNPEPSYAPLNKENSKRIEEFIRSNSSAKPIQMENMINIPISVNGVSLNLRSGFSIYSDLGEIYGTSFDNCTICLEDRLSTLRNKEVFHEKDGSGFYLYVFYNPIKMKIVLNGKIFKRYDFMIGDVS